MQSRVYAVIRDSAKGFVLASEVQEWLNEGNLELAKRLRVLRKTTTGSTDGTAFIPVPADFLEALTLDIGGGKAEFVRDPSFDARVSIGGTPSIRAARVFGNNIEVFPAPPGATAYTLRHLKTPAAMSADGNTSELPESLHVKVVNYARAHAKYKEGDFDAGDRYMAMYEQGLPPAGAEVLPRVPGQAPADTTSQP